MNYSLVPVEEIGAIWDQVAPFIEAAIEVDPERYDTVDVFADLLSRKQSLWIGFDDEGRVTMTCTVRVLKYPKCKILSIETLSGEDMEAWIIDGMDLLKSYAREIGCRYVEASGRHGWRAAVKKTGGRMIASHYRFEVGEG